MRPNNQSLPLRKLWIRLISNKLDWMNGLCWMTGAQLDGDLTRIGWARLYFHLVLYVCFIWLCRALSLSAPTTGGAGAGGVCSSVRGAAWVVVTFKGFMHKVRKAWEDYGQKSGGFYQRYWSWLTDSTYEFLWSLSLPPLSLSPSLCIGGSFLGIDFITGSLSLLLPETSTRLIIAIFHH